MAPNLGKCHCIGVGDNKPYHKMILNNKEIISSILTLLSHVTPHCKKAGQNFGMSHLVHAKNFPKT